VVAFIFICSFIFTVLAVGIYLRTRDLSEDEKENIVDKAGTFFASAFFVEFIVLIILLGLLTWFLVVKKRVVHQGASTPNFRNGVCTLVIIVLIFTLSFPFRILNDLLVINIYPDASRFTAMMYDLFLGIPYDLIPITLILFLHRRNLKAQKRRQSANDGGRLYGGSSSEENEEENSVMGSFATSSVSTNQMASSNHPRVKAARSTAELRSSG